MNQIPTIDLYKNGEHVIVNVVDQAKWEADGWTPEKEVPPAEGTPEFFETLTVAALKSYATDKGIEVPAKAKKDEIIALLVATPNED